MRICLINPAWLFRSSGDVVLSHNLALSSLAAYLREKGSHDVTILDALAEGFRRRTRQKDGTLRVGLSNQEIAAQLVVSERTVRAHVSNILDKLHLANRTQAALYAIREGLTNAS